MNTSFNYRANMSNLLSTEFMVLREHMNTGGIAYYNTTWSGEALATGAAAFPYALRILNFLAVSDSPLVLDKNAGERRLPTTGSMGNRILILAIPAAGPAGGCLASGRYAGRSKRTARIAKQPAQRYKSARLITDDNMGTEWLEPLGH